MTCNMAYKKSTLIKIKGFDTIYKYNSDRDVALKVKRVGKIIYNNKMIVTHQKKYWTFKSYLKSAVRVENRILLYKNHGETYGIWNRIVHPRNLLKIIFPPLLIYTFSIQKSEH